MKLESKLNAVIRLQIVCAVIAVGACYAFGKPSVAFSVGYVSFILVLSGLSLGAGIIKTAETEDPLKGIKILYVRAFIRFLVTMALLVVGFLYLDLNIIGVFVGGILFYFVPFLELGREAMSAKNKNT